MIGFLIVEIETIFELENLCIKNFLKELYYFVGSSKAALFTAEPLSSSCKLSLETITIASEHLSGS